MKMTLDFGNKKASVILQHKGRIRNYFMDDCYDCWCYSKAGGTIKVTDAAELAFLATLMIAFTDKAPAIFT